MMTEPAFTPVSEQPDHSELELRILERWRTEGTFEALRAKNAGNEPFSFIDGPITANNSMGVHHAWGRSLKDLFQRYQAGLGKDQRYQNGFDCSAEYSATRSRQARAKRSSPYSSISRLEFSPSAFSTSTSTHRPWQSKPFW